MPTDTDHEPSSGRAETNTGAWAAPVPARPGADLELEPGEFGAPATDAFEPPRPVNWNLLTAEEAEVEWHDLNDWVHWLRAAFGLPPPVVPPYWHRHEELVWELSALHLHWLNSYDPNADASAPLMWLRDFAEARHRLREWVATCGTRLDRDRPTRQTTWPGENPIASASEVAVTDREADFRRFVREDVAARRRCA